MKIAWWSNAVWARTGYGTQSDQVIKRLMADGHEVGMIANWGLTGSVQQFGDLRVYPQGAHPYSLDVADIYANHFFEGERGLIVCLYDVWPIQDDHPDIWKDHDAWFWTPIDHAPPPPRVQAFLSRHNAIAMTEWGAQQMAENGFPPGYTIPHAIETSVFKPSESDIRSLMNVPEDGHLTNIVMANIGQVPYPRKCWAENLLAWKVFAERHDDAYLYIHTQLRHPRGVDLVSLMRMWGLPEERVRIVDQGVYAAGMVSQEDLAAIYSAADVTLMATAGEGFGIPALESAACGTPVIGSNFSAQTEVIGPAGWLVPYATIFDYQQQSFQALPEAGAIVAALEASYDLDRHGLRDVCIEHAAQYDADKVYADMWRPLLAEMTA